jgi:putative ABC transport system permease protein
VVGTTPEFFTHYKFRDGQSIAFIHGRGFANEHEAVIGHEVAESRGLKIGDKLVLSHGHTEDGDGFEKHDDHPFTVVGVTKFTGTPIDRSVYVSLEGLGAIHEVSTDAKAPSTSTNVNKDTHAGGHAKEHHHDEHEDSHGHADEHDHDHEHGSFATKDGKILVKYVSGFFIGAKSRMSSLELQRNINTWEGEALLAIMPGMAMAELWKNLAIFESALSIVSALVVFAGMIGLFVSLLILSGQRQHEMIVLRAIGAGPSTIFILLAGEAVAIVLSAIILGMGVMYLGLLALSPWLEKKFAVDLPLSGVNSNDIQFALVLLVVGAFVGVISSLRAYRTAMHDGLTTKF